MAAVEKINLDKFYFESGAHLRYEHGKPFTGIIAKGKRGILIEKNPEDKPGYWLSIYNLDEIHPIFNDNLQMSPKQMIIISSAENKIVLRGWDGENYSFMPPIGSITFDGGGKILDNPSFSFTDYGVTIIVENNEAARIIVHMHERNIDIEYYSDKFFNNMQEVPNKLNL